MIKSFNGKTPKIAASAFVSQAAMIIGDVEVGENCGIYPGVVVRGDFNPIRIGKNTDIEDNCVLHVRGPMEIGADCVLGHGVVIQCAKVGRGTLIGMNATVLDAAEIGEGCVIAAGCVVMGGAKIPDGSFVVGVPGVVKGKVSEKQKGLVPEHFADYTPEFKKKCSEAGL